MVRVELPGDAGETVTFTHQRCDIVNHKIGIGARVFVQNESPANRAGAAHPNARAAAAGERARARASGPGWKGTARCVAGRAREPPPARPPCRRAAPARPRPPPCGIVKWHHEVIYYIGSERASHVYIGIGKVPSVGDSLNMNKHTLGAARIRNMPGTITKLCIKI